MADEDISKKFDDIQKLEEEYDQQQAMYKAEGMEEQEILSASEDDDNGSFIKTGIKTGVKKVKDAKEAILGDILPF